VLINKVLLRSCPHERKQSNNPTVCPELWDFFFALMCGVNIHEWYRSCISRSTFIVMLSTISSLVIHIRNIAYVVEVMFSEIFHDRVLNVIQY
jgi:hypothetical protein